MSAGLIFLDVAHENIGHSRLLFLLSGSTGQRRELRAARQRRTVNSFVGISFLRQVEHPGPPISYLWNCLPLPSLSPPNQSRISGSGGVFHCLPTSRITGGAAAPYREFVRWNFIASTSGTPWASGFLSWTLSFSSISSPPNQSRISGSGGVFHCLPTLPLSGGAERRTEQRIVGSLRYVHRASMIDHTF